VVGCENARWSVGEVFCVRGLGRAVASCAACWFGVQLVMFGVGVWRWLDV
jgi:hypothetical protein